MAYSYTEKALRTITLRIVRISQVAGSMYGAMGG